MAESSAVFRCDSSLRSKEAAIENRLSGKPESCWTATAPKTDYPELRGSGVADVAVVGAGIVGLTAAYLLIGAGLSVAVLEARRIGCQVTGRSTAKITTQHSLIYRHLIETFDLETAQRYADANRLGMEQIRHWVEQLEIPCDFEQKDAYAYVTHPSGISDLEAEAEAARKVGFEPDLLDSAPLPFKTVGTLRFRTQAQFNPAQYLIGLARASAAAGAQVFEQSSVTSVGDNDGWQLATSRSRLRAKNVVLATNLPIAGPIPYDQCTRPRSHIAMAFLIDSYATIDGMFIGIDEPKRSLRMGRDRDGPLLVILGSKFDTGHEANVAPRFRDLETWTRQNLDVRDVAWRWVNEDYDTADRVPFAGRVSESSDLYVATGFNAWGISNGRPAY